MLFMLVFVSQVTFLLLFYIRPELERIHKLLVKKNKETKRKLTVNLNNVRHIICAHFHIAGCFFIVISYVGLKLERIY